MKKVTFFLFLFLLITCEERSKEVPFSTPKSKRSTVSRIIDVDLDRLASLNDSLLLAFYKKNNYKTFWLSDSIRHKLLLLLNKLPQEGLFPKDFDLNRINRYETIILNLPDTSLVAYDILLTANLSRYIQKISKGSLDPNKLYDNWDLKANQIDSKSLLLNFVKKDSFAKSAQEIYPKHPIYRRLKEALKRIDAYPKENFEKIEIDTKLVLHDTNAALIIVKKKLMYWQDLKPQDSITAVFDSLTFLAVKRFQLRHGLNPDGIIGTETVSALAVSKKQRKEQILINMERWRWYPRQFENNYLLINIPDCSLLAIAQNDTTLACKVIVGKPKRMTPILSSKLSYLVLNPTWTVPPTILEEDILPAILRDSTYLKRKNIKVYDTNNQLVDSLNWDAKKATTYRYVQSLGSYNALGKVKFIFSNRFTIYLHDTNSKVCFNYDNRALSSGCIRVQKPLKLTAYVLNNPKKWSMNNINKVLKKGKTQQVSIHKDIYVHILYWTAWSEKGSLQFRKDLYHLDADLYQKLSN